METFASIRQSLEIGRGRFCKSPRAVSQRFVCRLALA